MKKNRLKRELLRWGMLLAFPALMSSCLMEYPEMTADGELGVDPTSVTVKAKILIDLKSLAAQETGRLARAEDEEAAYSHRIVVAAYEDRQLVQQEVIYEDLSASSRLQTRENASKFL